MRILYVNPNLIKLQSAPGIWGRQVLKELRAAGAQVSSFPVTPAGNSQSVSKKRVDRWYRKILRENSPKAWVALLLEVLLMARGVTRTVRASFWIWRKRRDLGVDLILGRSSEYDLSPQIAARILKRPLVLEVHSPNFLERQLRGRRSSALLQRIERWKWRQCTRIWVHSATLKSILIEHGISADLVQVIPFGVDLDRFPPEKAQHSTNSPVRIVFVGSFFSWQGTDVLLRAVALARRRTIGIHLTLIGDGSLRSSCEKLAHALGLTDITEFVGWLPYDRVIERMSRDDIGVAPYTKVNPFYFDPAKILDYMATGLAVVGSDQGRVSEVIQHGETGLLVPPGDEHALADALVQLADDQTLRERLGRAAKCQIRDHNNWQEIMPRVVAMCEKAVEVFQSERRFSPETLS